MQLRVLGPVEASADHRSLPLGGAKQRAVLAMLGARGEPHGVRRPADRGPVGRACRRASAAKMVQQLRLAAAQRARRRRRRGDRDARARLRAAHRAGRVDARRFERLVARGAPRERAEPDAAREALALWRGPPLADVADEPFAAAEIRRLEELRLAAAELAIDADLAAGRHREVVGGDRGAGRRASAARAAPRAADARALPLRAPGRGARGLSATRGGCSSRDRRRARAGAPRGCTRRSCARTPRSRSCARHRPARRLDAGAMPPIVGRDGRCSGCGHTGTDAHRTTGRSSR